MTWHGVEPLERVAAERPRKLPTVAIVVPTLNRWASLAICLESISQQRYQGEIRTIVVDNGSSDGTPDRVAAMWPACAVIRMEENHGFASACNVGMQHALGLGSEFLLLANDDTELDEYLLDRLVSAAKDYPSAALLNPLVCFADEPDCVWANGVTLSLLRGFGDGADLGRRRAEVEQEGIKSVKAATGCVVLARADAIRQVGLLDERLFMYYEDVDWSLRCRRAGFEILAVPQAVAWHRLSRSQPISDARSAFLYYYNTRNRLAIMRRHAKWYHWAVFAPLFGFWLCLRVAGLSVLRRPVKRRAILRGLGDFARGSYPSRPYDVAR